MRKKTRLQKQFWRTPGRTAGLPLWCLDIHPKKFDMVYLYFAVTPFALGQQQGQTTEEFRGHYKDSGWIRYGSGDVTEVDRFDQHLSG